MSCIWIEYRRDACPICGHKQWCRRSPSGELVRCQRVQSDWLARPDGWLHRIANGAKPSDSLPMIKIQSRRLDCAGILQRYRNDTTTVRVQCLAELIGVTEKSLRLLGAVWSERYQAWAFPMRNANGTATGIRLRNESGQKWAVKDSVPGLFIPSLQPETRDLMICEGPTDTAALLDLGYAAIGRPSCNGSVLETADYVRAGRYRPIICGNYDEPKKRSDGSAFYPGQQGAIQLAAKLNTARIIYPPRQHKDFRDWLRAGGTRSVIQILISNSYVFQRRSKIG